MAYVLEPMENYPDHQVTAIANKYNQQYRAPVDAGYIRNGVAFNVQDLSHFTPNQPFAFSPLAQELMTVENAPLVLLALQFAKTPEGREQLLELAKTYIVALTGILTEICDSGSTHPLNHLNATTAFAAISHRFGLMTDSDYLKVVDQTQHIIDEIIKQTWAGEVLQGITTLTKSVAGGLFTGLKLTRGAYVPKP